MNSLFEAFDSVSSKEWKQHIQVALRGADFNDTLVWQSLEGINVSPFYHPDQFDQEFSAIVGTPESWNITQHIFIDDENIANKLATDALNKGANAILFEATSPFEWETVLNSIEGDHVVLYFELDFLSEDFLNKLIPYLDRQNFKYFINIDIISHLAKNGNWYLNKSKDFELLFKLIEKHRSSNLLSIDTSHYQNSGANSIQQVAYSLSHINEYLNYFEQCDLKYINPICFKVAVGSNYFFEIAKIRALRVAYASLANAYGLPDSCEIIAVPTFRNKTIYDYNTNMLRTSTECMSAVLGGANSICSMAYDALYHKSNEFGERISRNQLLILKHESYLDMVSNAADGSYYIEKLTHEIASRAIEILKSIENGGGFISQLEAGVIQNKIKESAEKEQELFDQGKIVLIGTNKYPNDSDRMKNEIELYPFVKHKPRKTIIEPIIAKRLSEQVEKERLDNE